MLAILKFSQLYLHTLSKLSSGNIYSVSNIALSLLLERQKEQCDLRATSIH